MPIPGDDNPQGTGADTPPLKSGSLEEIEDRIIDDILKDSDEDKPEDGEDDVKAEAKPEGDEPEDDTAEEGDAEEEDEDQLREKNGRFLSDDAQIRMEDGSVVTVKDLKDGNLRHADYTRKTMALSDKEKSVESTRQRVEQLEPQLSQALEWAQSVVSYFAPQRPDPREIETDPIGYQMRHAAWEQGQEYLNAVQRERQQTQERQTASTYEAFQSYRDQEMTRLLDAIPTLKNPQRFESFRNDVFKHGSEYGFTQQELGTVTDSRLLRVLNDAIQWRSLQGARNKAADKAKGKPPLAPGRRQEPEAQRGRQREKAIQTVRATGGKGTAGEAAWDIAIDKYIT